MKGTRRDLAAVTASPLVQRAYDAAMALTVIALPFSNFLMSQGAFLMLLAWALDRWKNGPIFRYRGWGFWQTQLTFWAVIALFTWLIIGQLWTSDLQNGWTTLRIKLPLLAFPLVLITGRWDFNRGMRVVRLTMAFSIAAACLAVLWAGYQNDTSLHAREWSPFISHIRFSLMIAFVWSWWFWRFIRFRTTIASLTCILLSLLGGWVIWKTASITGLFLVPLSGALILWMEGLGGESPRISQVRFGLRTLGLLAGILICIGGWNLKPTPPTASEMLQTTALGAVYQHFPERCLRENGNTVWVNVAWDELKSSWNSISGVPFDGPDGRNQELKTTLIRFLASRNLTKDALGVDGLSREDIQYIESGIPTILEIEHQGLRRRWDIVQFEIANWLDGGDPSGHSLVQRFAFLHAASYMYHRHPLLGVGTGDLNREFDAAYVAIDSPLQLPFRLRAHNQYFTFLISGGPIALILWLTVLFSLYFPKTKIPQQRAALSFLLILGLSCLFEDTLETQAGVTFSGFFIGLFGRKAGEKSLQKPEA
ncbi:MAG: O-antigen ligase family protein [Flavobacteriales bacterium]|nr:O-antigen ligase family protein [Flavobacteriales bacterium]